MKSSTTARVAILRILQHVHKASVREIRAANPGMSLGSIADAIYDLHSARTIYRVSVGTYALSPATELPKPVSAPTPQSYYCWEPKERLMSGKA